MWTSSLNFYSFKPPVVHMRPYWSAKSTAGIFVVFTLLVVTQCFTSGHRDVTTYFTDQGNSSSSSFCVPSAWEVASLIQHWLHECQWEQVIIISDDDLLCDKVIQYIVEPRVYTMHFVIPLRNVSDTATWKQQLYEAYRLGGFSRFILFSHQGTAVLEEAMSIISKENRVTAATHLTKWMIVVAEEKFPDFVEFLEGTSCLYDHVITVKTDESLRLVLDVHTLMWRSHDRRQLQIVFLGHPADSTATCEQIFPNVKFHLNGRELLLLGKRDPSFLNTVKDPVTNSTVYKGFLMDMISVLSESLNFTFSIVPSIPEAESITWDDYVVLVEQGTVDIGLSLWPSNFQGGANVTMPSFFFFTYVTGAYVNHEDLTSGSPIFNSPYSNSLGVYVILCAFASLILMSGIHIVVYRVARLFQIQTGLKFQNRMPSRMAEVDTFFRFFGAMMNQGCLPQPFHASQRILLVLWSLSVLILSATYTGNLTADLVNPEPPARLRTLSDVKHSGEYGWGTHTEAGIFETLLDLPDEELASGIREFSEYYPDVSGDLDLLTKKLKNEKFVFIYYRAGLEALQVRDPFLQNRLIFLEDQLFQAPHSLLLPPGSGLLSMFSKQLEWMMEAGLTDFLYQRQLKNAKSLSSDIEVEESKTLLDLSDLLAVCVPLTCVIGVATIVLCIECLHHFLKSRHSSPEPQQ